MDVDDKDWYPTIKNVNWYTQMSPDFLTFWEILFEKKWAKSF